MPRAGDRVEVLLDAVEDSLGTGDRLITGVGGDDVLVVDGDRLTRADLPGAAVPWGRISSSGASPAW
ncbi:hypothetical protein [Streptantibioticus ferralitis]|uniref:Uncharacterized protein n=1 Tax=Streptantibioticus ferralitis TaxID=236510 RepID=A0ABT5YTT7_9ACTN|nr:hypothetical protein [Streptantibioticus ferralitis]MDF2255027.1 hypothetical protein [Streptantibioticus ferralitis]